VLAALSTCELANPMNGRTPRPPRITAQRRKVAGSSTPPLTAWLMISAAGGLARARPFAHMCWR
jgi:hypothetical protein